MAEVRLEGLEKRYDNDTLAVKGITFTAKDGEFVVMVGPEVRERKGVLRVE